MTAYNSSLSYISNGEPVEAGVANRTAAQLQQNTDYLKSVVDAITTNEYVIALNRVVSSDTAVATPVYYNSTTAQFEPAQAVSGKEQVVGVIRDKPTSTTANIIISGTAALDITGVLDIGQTLTAGRYYLSETTAGKLTKTAPYHYTGAAALQMSVLVNDGSGRVYVAPSQILQGAQGPQGPAGSMSSSTWPYWQPTGTSPFERWILAGLQTAATTVLVAPVTATLSAVPFISTRTASIDRLGIKLVVSAATGSQLRVGIYNNVATGPYPNALVFDSGAIASDTPGKKSATVSGITLTAGQLYWFVLQVDGYAPVMTGVPATACAPVLGLAATMDYNVQPGIALKVARAYAALPTTFPAGATIVCGVDQPAIACRYSS